MQGLFKLEAHEDLLQVTKQEIEHQAWEEVQRRKYDELRQQFRELSQRGQLVAAKA